MTFQSTPSSHGTAPGRHEPGELAVGGHTNLHGRPASWAVVALVIVFFVAGAFAIVNQAWLVFWVCVGLVVLSMLAGWAIGIMKDTVLAGNPAMSPGQEHHVAEDTGSAADPGVDMGTPAAEGRPGGAQMPRVTGSPEAASTDQR